MEPSDELRRDETGSAPARNLAGSEWTMTVGADRRPEGSLPALRPTGEALVDRFGRVHTDLRISVTDRCNFRCTYCMPAEGLPWLDRSDILTFEEITRVARVTRGLGVRSVRLTGGEPLARRGLATLVGMLASVGFDDLAMTTNGVGLDRHAAELAGAGLHRVNVSCDSLRPDRFARITRRDELAAVLRGMDGAEDAGLAPLKVNVVMMVGVNDDEVLDFARFARRTGRVVRFLEYMPLDADHVWETGRVVPGEEILSRIHAVWPLEPASQRQDDGAPADRFRFVDGGGEIGVITSVSRPFCGTCTRLRLTSDGTVRNCLFGTGEWSARDLMRAGGSDDDLARLLQHAVWEKRPGHGTDSFDFLRPQRSMSMIGG